MKYLIIINIFAIVITLYDKWASINLKTKRIREKTLLAIAILGGSLGMLLAMMIVTHKTQKPKFVYGIPLIVFLQISLLYKLSNGDILSLFKM